MMQDTFVDVNDPERGWKAWEVRAENGELDDTDLERRLKATQRACSALVHHQHLDVEACKALDDAINEFPASHWTKVA